MARASCATTRRLSKFRHYWGIYTFRCHSGLLGARAPPVYSSTCGRRAQEMRSFFFVSPRVEGPPPPVPS